MKLRKDTATKTMQKTRNLQYPAMYSEFDATAIYIYLLLMSYPPESRSSSHGAIFLRQTMSIDACRIGFRSQVFRIISSLLAEWLGTAMEQESQPCALPPPSLQCGAEFQCPCLALMHWQNRAGSENPKAKRRQTHRTNEWIGCWQLPSSPCHQLFRT